eukprot:14645121-Alexandrium_andersonii.AAC.1
MGCRGTGTWGAECRQVWVQHGRWRGMRGTTWHRARKHEARPTGARAFDWHSTAVAESLADDASQAVSR